MNWLRIYVAVGVVTLAANIVWITPGCLRLQQPTKPVTVDQSVMDSLAFAIVWPLSWLAYYGIYSQTGHLCGVSPSKEKS